LASGGAMLASQYHGKGDMVSAGKITNITMSLSLLSGIIISVLVLIFPKYVFGIFTTDAAVLEIMWLYLPIAVLLFYGSAMRSIMNALLNGSGNYKINFVTAILDGIIMRIGLAVLFGLVLNLKHYGFWLGDALAGFTPFVIGVFFYFSGVWKKDEREIKNK